MSGRGCVDRDVDDRADNRGCDRADNHDGGDHQFHDSISPSVALPEYRQLEAVPVDRDDQD